MEKDVCPGIQAASWAFLVTQDTKESACNARDPGSIPGWERSLGEGNGNPLQYSCLENPIGRGAWWATVHEVTKELDMTEQLTLWILEQPLLTAS